MWWWQGTVQLELLECLGGEEGVVGVGLHVCKLDLDIVFGLNFVSAILRGTAAVDLGLRDRLVCGGGGRGRGGRVLCGGFLGGRHGDVDVRISRRERCEWVAVACEVAGERGGVK